MPVAKPTSRRPSANDHRGLLRCLVGGQTSTDSHTVHIRILKFFFWVKKKGSFFFLTPLDTKSFHFFLCTSSILSLLPFLFVFFPPQKNDTVLFLRLFFQNENSDDVKQQKTNPQALTNLRSRGWGALKKREAAVQKILIRCPFLQFFGEFILLCKNKNEQKWQFYMYIFVYM